MQYRGICRTLATGLLAVVLASPAAAGGSGHGRTVKITATEFSFEPASIKAQAGEMLRIKLVNRGALSHNLQIKGAGIQTETLQSGSSDTIEFTIPEDGTVRFFCNVPGHKQAGMTGKIIPQ